MTKVEAIEVVEHFAETIRIKTDYPYELLGIQIVALASEVFPEIDQIQDEFFLKNGDPLRYVDGMLKILRQFKERPIKTRMGYSQPANELEH